MNNKREKIQYIGVFFADLIALIFSIGIAWVIIDGMLRKMPQYEYNDFLWAMLLLTLAYICTFLLFDQREDIVKRNKRHEFARAVKFNLLLGLINSAGLALTKAAMLESRYFLLLVPIINVFLMTASHIALKEILKNTYKMRGLQSLVGVITTADHAENMIRDLYQDWSNRIVGLAIPEATDDEVGQKIAGVPIAANYVGFMDWLRRTALDEVYVDIPMDSGSSFVPFLEEMESMGLTVHFSLPTLNRLEKDCCSETSAARLSSTLGRCAGHNMVTIGTVELSMTDQILKRALDIVGSIVGCIISIPIIAVVAIPLKLESPGPLFFKQRRVGLNGREFYIHKLRSMYMDAEERKKELMAQNEMTGLMFKMQDDPRITKVGKFIRKTSIDELPQFFDVLRGPMSLVGTRPPTLDEYKQYESHHKRRLSMKPGITGLWQVSGRSSIEDFEEVVKLDTTYIDNWTFWGDIRILFKTVWVVFARRGAE